MKRRDFLAGVSALAILGPAKKANAWIHGSSLFWQLGQRPFTANSPINQLLPANSILVPLPWLNTTGGNGNAYAAPGVNFDQPSVGAPTVAITTSQSGWGNPPTTFNRQVSAGVLAGYPTDNNVLSLVGNDLMSIFGFVRTDTTHAAGSQYAGCNVIADSGFGISSEPEGSVASGTTAIGSSLLAGALVKQEFGKGGIKHAFGLIFPLDYSNRGTYYSPAINTDCSDLNGFASQGQFLAIPQGASMPSGLTSYGQEIFTQLQTYGAIFLDSSPHGSVTNVWAVTDVNDPAGSWTNADFVGSPNFTAPALLYDFQKLFPLLQKVGYALDGIAQGMNVYGVCAPQLQSVFYNGAGMHITRDSDSTSVDIGFGAVPQSLLNVAAITAFCAGTTGRATKFYDQSITFNVFSQPSGLGGHDFISSGASDPIIYQSGALKTINGLPVIEFNGTDNYFKMPSSSSIWPASGKDIFMSVAAVQITDYAANYGLFGSASANGLALRIDQTTGVVRILKNGGATIGVTPWAIPIGVPVDIEASYNADGSYWISFNGVRIVQGTGTLIAVTAGDVQWGASGPAGTELFKGKMGGAMVAVNVPSNPLAIWQSYLSYFWPPLGTISTIGTTLDPSFTSSLSYSADDLTVSSLGTFPSPTRGTVGKTSGIYYSETTVVNDAGNPQIGLANSSNSFSVAWADTGAVTVNGSTVTTIANFTTGSLLSMVVDFTHLKAWFRVGAGGWNNDILANQNPATNTGGISIAAISGGPFYPLAYVGGFGTTLTYNFGATAWADSSKVPAGMSLWQ